MQLSHSRIECFEKCPYKYKMRYVDGLSAIGECNADNALYLGTALHTGLEKGVKEAIKEYLSHYPILTDEIETEIMKLEYIIPKAKECIPDGEFEVKIDDEDFQGYIDLLAPSTGFHESEIPDVFDIYDFKYSNNIDTYKKSNQLHLYKYFFERCNPGKKIRKMYFLFVPKVNIKQKKTETISEFRYRVMVELRSKEPTLVEIDYDQEKVIDFLIDAKRALEATEYRKNMGWLCNYCEFKEYCQKGIDYMITLPENKRREVEKTEKKVIWLYGLPFSGKTYFANKFPDPLMLNSDGNIKFVDAPYIPIKDQIEKIGRRTERTLAWVVLKEVIGELEKKENSFKSIVVDLLEDMYEHCRLYMYDQMGITHESDDSFKAWDKVTTEFLSTLKRLMNLDYENIILISHEDTTKDLFMRGGDKVTAIKPNIREKVALKVAGMVDIVGRCIAEGDQYTISFKKSSVIFGGGRLTIDCNEIPADYDRFCEIYGEANKNNIAMLKGEENTSSEEPKTSTSKRKKKKTTKTSDVEETPVEDEKTTEKEPITDDEGEEIATVEEVPVEEPQEEVEPPKTTRARKQRKRRT